MATYLITGASRGIGLELTKQLLELPTSQVTKIFALARNAKSGPLQELATGSQDRIVLINAAVDDTSSVQKAAELVKTELKGQGLDVLVNNAGIGGWTPDGIKSVKADELSNILDVNVVGPQRVITAFLPLLEAGKQKKVINVSSALGSIQLTDMLKFAPSHAYKVSKAALNMLTAQYASDFADTDFTFLCLSPGWLKTDMGGQEADLDVQTGVAEVKRIILEANKKQNGKFLNIKVAGSQSYDGGEIPW